MRRIPAAASLEGMNPSIRQLVIALLMSLTLAACTSPAPPPSTATPVPAVGITPPTAASNPTPGPTVPKRHAASPADKPTDFDVELSRSGCYGRCPSYRVSLRGDGAVRFVGERYTAVTGEHQAQISAAEAAAFLARLRSEPFASLKGRYTPDDPRCGPVATDMASVSIAITDNGATRRIEHYLGCANAPASLYALATAIDEVTGSARWVNAPTE